MGRPDDKGSDPLRIPIRRCSHGCPREPLELLEVSPHINAVRKSDTRATLVIMDPSVQAGGTTNLFCFGPKQ